ncbi:MAG: penicillin-binding protein 2 [Candidatus Nealsonbacteria bacterium]|nr:penicillin-binding protein 2 [Candidatus Nealsonbacteria bacterium]
MYEFNLSKGLKNKKIKTFFKENIEPEEIILDNLAKNQEEKAGLSDKKIETPFSKKTLFGFYIFVLLLFFSFFLRTFQFQVIQKENFLAQARANKFIIHSLGASRGVIYDRNWQQLVFNKPSFDLIYNKLEMSKSESEKKEILKEVSLILGINPAELEKQIKESANHLVPIVKNLDHQNLIILKANIDGLTGFQILESRVREYKDGPVFSHLLGYTAQITPPELRKEPDVYSIFDYVGRTGLERSYQAILRKNSGELRLKRDALGNIISQEIVSLPESGKSLVLWLDADLQRKLKQELESKRKELGASGAVAIAMDPRTGGLLSLVSLPNFDNNLFQRGADPKSLQALLQDPKKLNPLFNRAIAGRYLIGSTIKPLIALAALEEKIISPEKQLYTRGFIEIPHQYAPGTAFRFRDWTNHGRVDMKKAIAQSSNVYFYTIGGGYGDQKGLGPTKIKEYLNLFGWGKKTGIDLPGEVAGFIPDREWKRRVWGEPWWDGDTYNLSIGQGYISITPLEITAAFGAVANGGILYQPRVVKKIVDTSMSYPYNIIERFEPEIIRQNFVDPKNLEIVRKGMRQAVTGENSPRASAVMLNSLPVTAAAKTGTAELGNDRYHNWVTIFAPYEDPEIVLTVMIENTKGIQLAVLPVAKEILEWYFNQQPSK